MQIVCGRLNQGSNQVHGSLVGCPVVVLRHSLKVPSEYDP
jgi:hypothetical protein